MKNYGKKKKFSHKFVMALTFICLFALTFIIHPDKSSAINTAAQEEEQRQIFRLIKQPISINRSIQLTKSTVDSLDGKGPDSKETIILDEQMEIESYPEFDRDQIFSLSPTIFPDNNRSSGIYYYLPGKYYLAWNKEDGYMLRFYYKGEVPSGEKKTIYINFWLTPSHTPEDYQLLKKLLEFHLGSDFKKLIRLPAEYDIHLDMGAFTIPEDQITISGIDADTGEIHIVVETDVVTKEMLEDQLEDLGWVANLTITPVSFAGETPVPPQSRTINIRLFDRDAFTQKTWYRERGEFSDFTNEYAFPLALKHLYFLRKMGAQKLKVFGYDLGDIVLSPGESAKIRNARIHETLDDANTLKAWVDFSLIRDEQYLSHLMDVITGGVGDVPVKTLSIVAVNAEEFFDKYNIFEISVQVYSANFDPKGEKNILKTYKLTRNNPVISRDPLYLPAGAEQPGLSEQKSLFKYKINVIDNKASRYSDEAWREGEAGEATIYVGETHTMELMGATEEPAPEREKAGEKTTTEETADKTQTLDETAEPSISRIEPSSVAEGEPFVLKIFGSGFQLGTKVLIEVNVNAGTDLEPEFAFMEFECVYIDSSQIQVSFDRGFGADPDKRNIYVQNPNGLQSDTVVLKIV
ncbi:MAG: hypothetical protein OEZ52_16470, partial [Candidatus Aminicenantes bacterium]|nr:hypothetical protein [Candidatus Aminicenantes bacterium]